MRADYKNSQWLRVCEGLDYRDGKRYWDSFCKLKGKKGRQIVILEQNGSLIGEPNRVAEISVEKLQNTFRVHIDNHFD